MVDSDTPPQLVAFYDTLGIRRTHSRFNPRALTGRKGTKAIQKLPFDLEEQKLPFVRSVKDIIKDNNILSDLVINF